MRQVGQNANNERQMAQMRTYRWPAVLFSSTHVFQVVWSGGGHAVCCWWLSPSRCHYHREKQGKPTCTQTHVNTNTRPSLAVSFSCAQTHRLSPAPQHSFVPAEQVDLKTNDELGLLLCSGLFFLRLECGQECVVALLALRGRRNLSRFHAQGKRREKEGRESSA